MARRNRTERVIYLHHLLHDQKMNTQISPEEWADRLVDSVRQSMTQGELKYWLEIQIVHRMKHNITIGEK